MRELMDWASWSHDLALRDRWPQPRPQGRMISDLPYLQYERACSELDLPMLHKFFWYAPQIEEMVEALVIMLQSLGSEYDGIALWSEWCWYNEVAKQWARECGLPVIFVERATFPGMLIVDGTGLSMGRSDLSLFARSPMEDDEYRDWLSLATCQAIEPQRLTTPGQVAEVIRDRPTVFVPLQMPYDTNMVFRAGHVNTNDKLLDWVDVHRKADEQVVVKKHPSDWFTDPARLAAKCVELGFVLVDFATHPLLEQVSEVVTINSQVGVEAWMHEVPVQFLGEPGFVLEGLSPRENIEALLAYYIAPAAFAQQAREIIERQKGDTA